MQTVALEMQTVAKSKKRKSKKSKKIIAFDEEVVTKSVADKIISEENLKPENASTTQDDRKKSKQRKRKQSKDVIVAENKANTEGTANKKKRKRKTDNLNKESHSEAKTNGESDLPVAESHEEQDLETDIEAPVHKKKRNANKPRDSLPLETQSELNPSKPSINKEESIRARKRRVHAELLQKKRLHNEAEMQKKCLNYLSKWKHDKEGWKFEKLKQFWLTQSLFDDARIPDEFFQVTVEYFESAKGKARDDVLKNALGIVDKENEGEENKVKYERARMLVQSLQE